MRKLAQLPTCLPIGCRCGRIPAGKRPFHLTIQEVHPVPDPPQRASRKGPGGDGIKHVRLRAVAVAGGRAWSWLGNGGRHS